MDGEICPFGPSDHLRHAADVQWPGGIKISLFGNVYLDACHVGIIGALALGED